MLKNLLFCCCLALTSNTFAANAFTDVLNNARNNTPQVSQPTVLPVEQAFAIQVLLANKDTVQINWKIAPDYYLYRDKIKITSSHELKFELPSGTKITDDFFGDQIVYFDHVAINVPLSAELPNPFSLMVTYQGCAKAGFCYPPITQTWEVNKDTGVITVVDAAHTAGAAGLAEVPALEHASANTLAELLAQTPSAWIWAIFFGLGLLLTFTPCVLPMIPILSSIIVGHHAPVHAGRAFLLSLSYVMGMAITYSLAGVFAGLAGQTLQAYLQTPFFIGACVLLLLLLALNLFGCYQLKMPARWHNSLTQFNQSIKGGRFISAFILGFLSALIVSPCVTAPLIGALTYISTTGDAWLGGSALFALALGMGTPLMIIGTFGPQLLPKAGHWLVLMQQILGVLLIAVAIWLLSRLVSQEMILALWGIAAVLLASYLGALQTNVASGWPRFWQGVAWILLLAGALLFIRAGQSIFGLSAPVAMTSTAEAKVIAVKTWSDVQQQIKQSSKPVLLDFYADWCITCKIIEQQVFPDPQVAALLQRFTVLRADVTAQDAMDIELQKAAGVFAPPALLFFAPKGTELGSQRLVGDVDAERLVIHLEQILQNKR